jgi:hypothetical protein
VRMPRIREGEDKSTDFGLHERRHDVLERNVTVMR